MVLFFRYADDVAINIIYFDNSVPSILQRSISVSIEWWLNRNPNVDMRNCGDIYLLPLNGEWCMDVLIPTPYMPINNEGLGSFSVKYLGVILTPNPVQSDRI